MIEDKTNGELDKIKLFAKEVGRAGQLQEQLDYLGNYAVQETKCTLYPDFAPHSLSFMMFAKKDDEWDFWFNGGLIFFNEGDVGMGAPQFTVRVGDDLSCGWSVHT